MSTLITRGLGGPFLITRGYQGRAVEATIVNPFGPVGPAPDTSDRMPDGGYLLPNWPTGWLDPHDPNTVAWLGAHDRALDGGRVALGQLKRAHLLPYAQGQDVDDLGALLDIARLPSEAGDDTRYKTRIQATARKGLSASGDPEMADYLAQALSVPVTVEDGPGLATFTVTLLAEPVDPSSVVALVREIKAFGTVPIVRMRIAAPRRGAGYGRLGTVRVGDAPLGGPAYFITLT